MTHRSVVPRSSGPSAERRSSRRPMVSARCCPASVRAGSLPFGGSVRSDVRPFRRPAYGFQSPLVTPSSCRRATKPAASSAVTTVSSANSSGRWSGVAVQYNHTPCRSGAPHGRRGTSVASSAGCAMAKTGRSSSNPKMATYRMQRMTPPREALSDPSGAARRRSERAMTLLWGCDGNSARLYY